MLFFLKDSAGIFSFDDWVVDDSVAAYMFSSSSDGEDSDGEILLNPLTEVDLPPVRVSTDDAITMTTHRLALIGRGQRRHRQVCCSISNLPTHGASNSCIWLNEN